MAMNEYDDSNFMISFMKEPTKKTLEEFQKAELEEANFFPSVQDRIDRNPQEFKKQVEEFAYDAEKKRYTITSNEKFSFTIKKGNNKQTHTIKYYRAKTVIYYLIK